MDVQLLNWLDCTAPYFDWPLSTRPLYSNTHQKLIYREPRVDVKVQRYRNLFSSRTGQHGSSHWPLPLRRWLIGQTTWSDRYSMCFDKPWPKPNCFICYTSRSPDARYIDVSVKKSDTSWSGVIKRWADLIQQALKIQKLLQRRQLNQYRQNCPWNIVSHKQSELFPYSWWCFRLLLLLRQLFPDYHGKKLVICVSAVNVQQLKPWLHCS